jgi:His-Xaa-Ser system protein HxsD
MGNKKDNGSVLVHFDSGTYSLTAIKKAAYKLGASAFFHITSKDGIIEVRIAPKTPATLDFRQLVGEFSNEVLDQDLREHVSAQTTDIRNLIIAHAFSRTSLIDADWDTADFSNDPEAINRHSDGTKKTQS